MLVIAVTGGIGSGKSTVADLFKAKGIPVIDTDEIARQLVQPGTPLLQQIITEFGSDCLDAHGQLNRKALRKLIFADAAARAKLEALMHPAIHTEVIAQLRKLDAPYCLILIPLLARSKQRYPYNRVLVVDTPEAIQIQRTMQRDQQDPDLVKQIIATQTPRHELLALADDVLDNSSEISSLVSAVDKLHQKYLRLSKAQA
jgi:dephospho-CoA kinase